MDEILQVPYMLQKGLFVDRIGILPTGSKTSRIPGYPLWGLNYMAVLQWFMLIKYQLYDY